MSSGPSTLTLRASIDRVKVAAHGPCESAPGRFHVDSCQDRLPLGLILRCSRDYTASRAASRLAGHHGTSARSKTLTRRRHLAPPISRSTTDYGCESFESLGG